MRRVYFIRMLGWRGTVGEWATTCSIEAGMFYEMLLGTRIRATLWSQEMEMTEFTLRSMM